MFKLLGIYFLIVTYGLTTSISRLLRFSELADRLGGAIAGLALRLLGVKTKVRGVPERGSLIVANHVSYVDILTLMSLVPCRFVTFNEFQRIPGIGLLAKLSGTLFVNRSNPSQIKKDIEQIEIALKRGTTIIFFPEGASFDGSELRPFKSSLFEAAIVTRTKVQPACLRYLEVDGESISLENRHRVFYYGDMQLVPQLMGLLKLRSLTVEVVFGSPIVHEKLTRKELADQARSVIEGHFLAVRS